MTAGKLIISGVTHGNLGRIHYISKTNFLSYIQINFFMSNPKYQVNIISLKQPKVRLPVCDEAIYLFYISMFVIICDMLGELFVVSVYWS